MSQKRIQQIEQRIDRIKRRYWRSADAPGSLTRSTRTQTKSGPTGRSAIPVDEEPHEYVRPNGEGNSPPTTHKRFKRLVDQWID